MEFLKIASRVLILMILTTGVFYQVIVSSIGSLLFWNQSHGSLVIDNNKIIGSELIGQAFTYPRYFIGRLPDVLNGIGTTLAHPSNLSLKSSVFLNRTQELKEFAADRFQNNNVPIELITGSGSGVDPHISRNMAYFQIDSVAKARNISSARIKNLVDNLIEYPQFLIMGQEKINLLKLNLALDQQFGKRDDDNQ